MSTQFPDFPAAPALPTEAVPDEQADPIPAPAPSPYITGTPQGHAPVVQPDSVARALGLPSPLDTAQIETLTEAIQSAQSDVEAYLGRPVVPQTYTENCQVPRWQGWRLKNYPVQSIVSATPETDLNGNPAGTYTVVYVAGLDTINDPDLFKIARFIKLHAMYDPMVQVLFRQLRPDVATRVMSGSTEGQSATITDALPVPAASRTSTPASVNAQMSLPGSLPTLQTLDMWRIGKRRVYQQPTRLGDAAPWPYGMPVAGTSDLWWGRFETWW